MLTPNNDIAVSIGGKPLFSFKSLKLHQPVNDHHRFELALDMEVAAADLKDGTEWLGKRMQVKRKGVGSPLFVGVVTKVNAYRESLDGGHVCVSGYSTTYLLENGENCHSWLSRTLGDIVGELCRKAGVQAQVMPEHEHQVGYVCQYGESDFTFIRRLAKKYQEWLYYDGVKLIFGKPKKPKAVKLEFDTTLTSFEMGVQTLARPVKVFSYQSKSDHSMAESTPNKPSGQDRLGGKAFQVSMEMFKEPALQYAASRVHHMQEMEMYVRKKQEAEAAESHYVVGTSEEVGLTTGSTVRITSPFGERIGSLTKASLGEYLIVDIEHSVGEGNYYANRFRAIPAAARSLPLPDVDLAVAETQMARVTSNADPEGKGRVQVRMNWQAGNMHTDWIRVMTPDGGGGENVASNRGFVFIPEVGDHVLVGFRHNDPNRPYVMGSLFNGKTGVGGFAENHKKSLTTRSGVAIIFDDTGQSLQIKDPSGNSVFMDGNGGVKITARDRISLQSTDIEINAVNNISIRTGNNFVTSIGNNWLTSVGNTINTVTRYMRNTIAGSLNIFCGMALWSSKEKMQLQSDAITAIGTKKMLLHSEQELLANSKGTLDMKSNGDLTLIPQAEDVKKEEHENISLAMVEFRTTPDYEGEFGLDWLRVDDGELGKQGHYSDERPYSQIIEGGYGDGKVDLTGGEHGTAYKALIKEYESIIVNMPPKHDNTKRATQYFVPYLTLYPKAYVDTLRNVDEDKKPKYEATLRVLVDIGAEEIDDLEIKYNEKIFDIDKPKLLQDKIKTENGKVLSKDREIRITCKEEIATESDGEICIYAYPKEARGKEEGLRERIRTMAGKIKVMPNGETQRKKLKLVLVCVRTNISGTETTGDFMTKELELLYRALYQSLVECEIEQYRKDEKGNIVKKPISGDPQSIELDLTDDNDFKILPDGTIGKNLTADGRIECGNPNTDNIGTLLVRSLRDKFLSNPANSQYADCFTIFSFGNVRLTSSMAGRVESVGVKNVMLSPKASRWESTLPHEVLHGLGLSHVHADGKPIQEVDRKYTYQKYTTDNIMKYNDSGIDDRCSTWQWQWEIIRKKL